MRGMCRQTAFVRVLVLGTGSLVVALGLTEPARGQCDPQELAHFVAADGAASDRFGAAVAMDGDMVVVGAHGADKPGAADVGAVYVFVRTGTTLTQVAKLVASDGAAGDFFGSEVAVHGDTIIVGAYRADGPGADDTGVAYVFVRSGGVWAEQAKLTSAATQPGDWFGRKVALDGDTALIGAYEKNRLGGSGPGSVYVFVRSGDTWAEQAKLTASDGSPGDGFGVDVVLDGDSALIGAYADTVGAETWAGSAYVFVRCGTTWTEQARLTAADAGHNDQFGTGLALAGNTALIGAQNDRPGGAYAAGSAYVFVRDGDVWTQQAKLIAADAAANDRFGTAVSLSGETALIGAWLDSHSGLNYVGSAYVFTRAGAIWTEAAKLTAPDPATDDDFGVSVVLDGDTAVIGAAEDDVGALPDAGSAYIYDLNCLACPGDLDCDGLVSFADLNPFVLRLSNPSAYVGMYPDCPDRNADIDGNGAVDFGDINPFVTLLSTQSLPAACP